MQISDVGLKLIQAYEGLGDGDPRTVNLEPYYCTAHVATVGWGHALTTPTGQVIDYDVFGRAKADQLAKESMQRLFGAQAITRAQADELLRKDVVRYANRVALYCDATTTQAQFDAMVSMCYNVGEANFASSAVARLHKAGQRTVGTVSVSGLAAQSRAKAAPTSIPIAFARWSNSNGQWTLGLYRRRLTELLVYGGHDLGTSLATGRAAKG